MEEVKRSSAVLIVGRCKNRFAESMVPEVSDQKIAPSGNKKLSIATLWNMNSKCDSITVLYFTSFDNSCDQFCHISI